MIIEQCNYDLANQFIQRILQRLPNNVEAREMLGVVQLETGLVQEARKVGSSFLFIVFSEVVHSALYRLSNLSSHHTQMLRLHLRTPHTCI